MILYEDEAAIDSRQTAGKGELARQIWITARKGSNKELGATQGTCPAKNTGHTQCYKSQALDWRVQPTKPSCQLWYLSHVLTDRGVDSHTENQSRREGKHLDTESRVTHPSLFFLKSKTPFHPAQLPPSPSQTHWKEKGPALMASVMKPSSPKLATQHHVQSLH